MNVYAISLKGHREQNEDRHNIILDKNNKNYYSIYDGHGGSYVSNFLHSNLYQHFTRPDVSFPLSTSYVNSVFDHVQNKLRKKHAKIAMNTGSTSLVVIQQKYKGRDWISIMNLGDSRCVLCKNNIGIALTKDHKPYWPEERRRIRQLGGNIKYDGNDWRIGDLSVSRSFGDLDATPYVTHYPELFTHKLSGDDSFIIMACDGLWDVVDNQEAVNFVINSCYDHTSKLRINKNINIAKKLGEYALKKGSMDNISIIVVFFD